MNIQERPRSPVEQLRQYARATHQPALALDRKAIHPLLHVEFGEDCHCLYVIRELQQEFDRSPRLQTKFHWVDDPQYAVNRSRSISIPRKAARTIALT